MREFSTEHFGKLSLFGHAIGNPSLQALRTVDDGGIPNTFASQ